MLTSNGAFIDVDPDSSNDCPLTEWEDWLPCNGKCVDNKIEGYQTRVRYHLVDGVPIEKYDAHVNINSFLFYVSIYKNM